MLGFYYVHPPIDYGLSSIIALGIFLAVLLVPFVLCLTMAICYCCWFNDAWDGETNKWRAPPTSFLFKSCYSASRTCACSCPGLIPGCRLWCNGIEREVAAEKARDAGYDEA